MGSWIAIAVGIAISATDVELDRHALLAPREVEESLPRLVQYLVQPARTERDKARVLFRWVTDRIRYDIDALVT